MRELVTLNSPELHNLSFKEFKKYFGPQATLLIRKKKNRDLLRQELGLFWTRDKFLRREHARLILAALTEKQEVNPEVLTEYQDHPLLVKAIARYCKKKGLVLPPGQPVRFTFRTNYLP